VDLRHLRYFTCVAEELHFGRAALRLGISQPPLSQQIRALEEELGVQLLERTSRRVRLTEAGRQFLPEARATMAQAEQAARTARLAHRGEVGRLRLGFSTSVPFIPRVVDALSRFRQAYPQVSLELDELPRDEQLSRVERGLLDVAIMRAFSKPDLPSNMQSLRIQMDGVMLAMRQDHPLAQRTNVLTLDDLRGEPMILFGGGNGAGLNERLIEECQTLGFELEVVIETASFATLLGLTAAGLGVTILSRSLMRLNVDTLAFRPLEVPFTSELLMLHMDAPSPSTSNFRMMIAEPQ
jgi:DNA-binding transcriptional LysR family regulator